VPAVETEALLALVDAVGPDDLRHAGIGSGEFGVGRGMALVDRADVEIVGAAEIILGAGSADGGKLAVAIHEELDLPLAPPA
jgi:hypothetical protein